MTKNIKMTMAAITKFLSEHPKVKEKIIEAGMILLLIIMTGVRYAEKYHTTFFNGVEIAWAIGVVTVVFVWIALSLGRDDDI